ncbi:hypothetical protein [Pseudotabrizicola sp.]|uniref:hypothetical protein n=1 Tax=Pseudotabrizicola sp. TaxID=2939647 RepID=UPI002715BBB0|nr:hypothetical protein [Pseudotabrizicola sp.]MDO8882653.1 hypothetical protein [Pseudotabrizicola sp.]
MNWRVIAALAAGLAVASCGGNPLGNEPECGGNPLPGGTGCSGGGGGTGGGGTGGDGTGGDGGTDGVPAEFQGNLRGATYNQSAGTLTVVIQPLGGNTREVTFQRDSTLDTTGYEAFVSQATDANRYYVALFDTSADGAVSAGVAGSGQFTEMVWGTTYSQDTAFSAPVNGGLATYTGRYAGILNGGSIADPSLPPGSPFEPVRPARTTGEVMINADFSNPGPALEGGIRGRRIVDINAPLDDVFLRITAINPDGTFAGSVTFADQSAAGTYAGTFGGAGGTAVAGALDLRPISGDSDVLERGTFVADRCGPGDPSPCPTTP